MKVEHPVNPSAEINEYSEYIDYLKGWWRGRTSSSTLLFSPGSNFSASYCIMIGKMVGQRFKSYGSEVSMFPS